MGRKSWNFYAPPVFSAPAENDWPRRNFVKMFDSDKTRMIWLPYGEKKLWQYVKPFSSNRPTGTLRTDRRTDGRTDRQTETEFLYQYRTSVCWCAIKTRSSAVAEKPRDASCHWIFCQVNQDHSRETDVYGSVHSIFHCSTDYWYVRWGPGPIGVASYGALEHVPPAACVCIRIWQFVHVFSIYTYLQWAVADW